MRWGWLFVGLVLVGGSAFAQGDDPKPPEKGAANEPKKTAGDEAGLREIIRTFTNAFNSGDSKALAAMHTADAHVVDPEGRTVEGREAIERDYAELFRDHPGASIEFSIDAVRFLGPDLAVEDGTSRVACKEKDAVPWINRYSVIYLRKDGRWLIAGDREYPGEEPSHQDRIKELGWMLGDWIDESEDSVVRTTCRYSPDRAFLIRDFQIDVGGKSVLTGTQRVGWDPQARQFKSWEFDSEGSHGDGLWARAGKNQWVVKARSVLRDGRTATATHQITAAPGDKIHWKTVDRTLGDATLPDIKEFVLVRRPPGPKQ